MGVTASLDTNVLVRLLVHDDVAQTDVARTLLTGYAQRSEALFVPSTVVLELEWVLRARYKFSKPDVLAALSTVMASVELDLESEDAMEQALANYDEGGADFADYVHLALAKKRSALPFWTFDKGAAKARGAKLLTAR